MVRIFLRWLGRLIDKERPDLVELLETVSHYQLLALPLAHNVGVYVKVSKKDQEGYHVHH